MPTTRYRVEVGQRSVEVEINRGVGASQLTLDGSPLMAELLPAGADGIARVLIGDRAHELYIAASEGRCSLALHGVSLEVVVEDERKARLARFGGRSARASGREAITAPMPGLVLRLSVEPGQPVQAGESLVVLQAMKMENELGSPRQGVVKSVAVQPGQAVEQGQILLELE